MGAGSEIRLGDLAVERGLITIEQLHEALDEQERLDQSGKHARLGQILIQQNVLSSEQLIQLLKEQGGVPVSPVPAVAEKYHILEELGAGSAGMVYLAEDIQLGRPVALKVLRSDTTPSKNAARRFFAEGKALAKLRHPGIVQVFEIGQCGDTSFIAMEYVPGETLEKHLLRGRLGIRDAATLMAEVCDAVEHAHAQGIIHRDLKPGNIMVEITGGARRIRVMDFGLAHDVFARTRMTATGAVIGTPMYMAPEQVSAGSIDVRTDVYALGAILYELVTGRAPYTGRTTYELYEAIVAHDPIPPRRVSPRVSPELELIVLTALNKLPSFRYQTAGEMGADLHHYLAGEPVMAKGLSWSRRLLTKARRRRVPLAIGAILLAVVAIMAIFVVRAAQLEGQFAGLLRDADQAIENRDFVTGARLMGQAVVLRPGDARLKPRREALGRLLADAVVIAESKLRDGKADDAAELARRVLAADPSDRRAAECLSRAEAVAAAQANARRDLRARLDAAEAAVVDCERSVLLPPSLYSEATFQDRARQARRVLEELMNLGDRVDATSRIQAEGLLGRLELYEGRAEAALEAFGRALAIEENGTAYYGRGLARIAQYRRERSMLGMQDEDMPKVYRERLEELRKAALNDFKKAREHRYGTGWETHYLGALVLHFEGEHERAIKRLDQIGKTEHVEAWLLRGDAYYALWKRREAISAYETAVDIARSDYNALQNLAEIRFSNALYGVKPSEVVDELDRAIQAIDTAIRARSTISHLYQLRGKFRLFKIERLAFLQRFDVDNELNQALADYEKAIALDPKDDNAQAGLGIILMQRGSNKLFRSMGVTQVRDLMAEFQRAADEIQEAIDLNPFEAYLYKDKGLALAMKGFCQMMAGEDGQRTLDEAFRLIRIAAERDKDSSQAYEALALAELWQATLELQKLGKVRPHLQAAIDASSIAVEKSSSISRGRTLAFRSVLRMVMAFYLFFFGNRVEAADYFDLGANDMKLASSVDTILDQYDPEPMAEFSQALRAQQVGNEVSAREHFVAAEAKLQRMANAPEGSGAFLARVFGRSMRGFCLFYTDRFQEAIDEWQDLTKQFPPTALVLNGWIAQAKKKLKK